MNLLTTPKPIEWTPRRCDILADTAAADDQPMHVPHWTADPAPRSPSWPMRTPDQQRAECHRQRFNGRLEGALIGFCIALLLIVGGCSVIAAMDRGAVARNTSTT